MQMKRFILFFIVLAVAAGLIFIPSILAGNGADTSE
jgi:hypothetical protein